MYREVQAKAVKDVPAEEFIKAYAAHLKSTDKVRGHAFGLVWGQGESPGCRRQCLARRCSALGARSSAVSSPAAWG